MTERWLPRPEEGLWPVEDQLEDSLEDLGTAGGGLLGWARVGGFSVHCQQTCLLLGLLCLPADDFLEPEEYAEPQEAKPGEAADLGRSERGLLAGGPREGGKVWPMAPSAHSCLFSRGRGHASIPEL